jgi:hypothetical protein
VDGNTDSNLWDGSVSHTDANPQAWWQVDLGAIYPLSTIKVWNRTDCCSERLADFYVFVSDVPFTSTDLTTTLNQAGISAYYTAGVASAVTTINVNRTGRYVRVQLSGTNFLQLAEVQVLEAFVTNLAAGRSATQSSTFEGNTADRAVDGNTDSNLWDGSVSHTDANPQAWWQVDLGAVYPLFTINVWNRTDCCSQRLADFYVFVSDVPFTSTDLTTTLNQAGVSAYYTAGVASAVTTINVNRTGRYVRIQLSGTNFLQLAEVEVFGGPAATPTVTPTPTATRTPTPTPTRTPTPTATPTSGGGC